MALFHTTVVDNQIKALPTVDTATGSIATFDTDLTENLVDVKCQIVAQQSGSGIPSPSNPRPITTYTSLNLSHSGSDTSNPTVYNIPFGQTVANGVLNVTTGVLEIKMLEVDMGNLTWTLAGSGRLNTSIAGVKLYGNTQNSQAKCSWYQVVNGNTVANVDKSLCVSFNNSNVCQVNDSDYNGGNPNDFRTAVTGQKIIYELQTPTTIQLTSNQVQALLNENNIWCDTGDTEVKYLLTVGKKIS